VFKIPPGYEVTVRVVDNASEPPVRPSIEGLVDFPHHLEILEESSPGKSHALNRGLLNLEADYVAFSDDDMEFDPQWLVAAINHMTNCDCGGIQGRIDIGGNLPHWFDQVCKELLGATTNLPEGAAVRGLHGGNMILQHRATLAAGPFRADLGPRGAKSGYSEDIEWSSRLLMNGVRLCYCPAAINYHIVEASRLKKAYLIRRQFDYARTETMLDGEATMPRWPVHSLYREIKQFVGALLVSRKSRLSFHYQLEVSRRAGRIVGLLIRLWAQGIFRTSARQAWRQ